MRIVKISDEAQELMNMSEFRAANTVDASGMYTRAAEEVRASLNAPIFLRCATKINYDNKTDRYTVTFTGNDKSVTLKCHDEVAEFVTAHIHEYGSWQGRMEAGELTDIYLVQV